MREFLSRAEQRRADAVRSRLESTQPCAKCDHAKRMHDTGWDAAGCMAGDCSCRGFEPKVILSQEVS